MNIFPLKDSMWNTSMAMRLGADFLSSRLSALDRSGTSLDIALVARALQLTRSTTGAEAAFEILAKRRQETLGTLFFLTYLPKYYIESFVYTSFIFIYH